MVVFFSICGIWTKCGYNGCFFIYLSCKKFIHPTSNASIKYALQNGINDLLKLNAFQYLECKLWKSNYYGFEICYFVSTFKDVIIWK